jgi:hypothetical protein
MDRANVGVRVALSGNPTSTNCGDPLVECYDMGGNNGVLYARNWANDTGTATAPKAHDVTLFPQLGGNTPACGDGYFTSSNATCAVGVKAILNFGGAATNGYQVQATVGNQKRDLSLVGTVPGSPTETIWQTSAGNNGPVSVDPAAGPVPITITWKKGNTGGDFGVAQRVFSASSARSGPIKLAQIFENGSFGANSFKRCTSTVDTTCEHNLVVKLGIQGSFQDLYSDATSVTTPVTLRFAGGVSGSQNQALDCDPWADPTGGNRGFEEEIAYGCRPSYKKNTGTACPSSPQTLWGNSTSQANQGAAWQCVAVETGDKTGQIGPGMNLRVLGSKNPQTCTRLNMWPEKNIGDPRIIHLFITQFGAFGGSGQNTVAVTNFATFYVTGWRGNGNADKNPCQDAALQSQPHHDDLVAEAGTIVGHFFEYTGPIEGTPSTENCNFAGPTPCISSLTQ